MRLSLLILLILSAAPVLAQQSASPGVSNLSSAQVVTMLQSQTTNGVTTYAEFLKRFCFLSKPVRCRPIKTNDTYRLVFSVQSETKDGRFVAHFVHGLKDDPTNAVLSSVQNWTNAVDGEIRIEVK